MQPRIGVVCPAPGMLRSVMHPYVEALAATGATVQVWTGSDGRDVPAFDSHRITVDASHLGRRSLDLRAVSHLARRIRAADLDVLDVHGTKGALTGLVVSRLAPKLPIVETVHGYYLFKGQPKHERAAVWLIEALAARTFTRVLSQNQSDAALALEQFRAPRERIEVIGNGIDTRTFSLGSVAARRREATRRALGIDGTFVVGFVGRIVAGRKGVEHLDAAMQQVGQSGLATTLLVVGDKDEGYPDYAWLPSPRYRRVLLGWQPASRMPALYHAMDAIVLPSALEGIPRALMEAGASGVPMIATAVKGNDEVVIDRQTGLLVPVGDPDAIAVAIGELYRDHTLRRRLGLGARRHVSESFDERRSLSAAVANILAVAEQRRTVDRLPALT